MNAPRPPAGWCRPGSALLHLLLWTHPPPSSRVSADEWYLPALPDGSLRRSRSAWAPTQERDWPPPIALPPAGYHGSTAAFKGCHNDKAITGGRFLEFSTLSRKLPASPHHGFQLQRHSQTGIREDTEQEAGGEYRRRRKSSPSCFGERIGIKNEPCRRRSAVTG